MIAFAELEKRLHAGERVQRRNCTVCKEPLTVELCEGYPVLHSCTCRDSGLPADLPLSWADLVMLYPETIE